MATTAGAGRIAAWSAAGGLLVVLMVGALTGRLLLDQRAGHGTALGDLAFLAVLAAPFVAVIAARFITAGELRRAVWLAAGALALLLGAISIFSVGFLMLAAGAGLAFAWWQAKCEPGTHGGTRSVVLTGWVFFWLGAALFALWLRETPACWSESVGSWVTSRTQGDCSSDIIDDTLGLLALVAVMAGFAGMAFIGRGRSWHGPAAQPATAGSQAPVA